MSKMRATVTFSFGSKRGDEMCHAGTVLESNDPIVKAFAAFFEPVPEPAKPVTMRRRRQTGG